MINHTDTLLDLVRFSSGALVIDDVLMTRTDLEALARRAASGLHLSGIGPGCCVLLIDNGGGVELLGSLLGAWWLGARACIVSGDISSARVELVARQAGAILVISSSESIDVGRMTYESILSTATAYSREPVCAPQDIALDIITSGTTAAPKCVSFTHAALWNDVRATSTRLRLTAVDRLYSPMPLSIAGVLVTVGLSGLMVGATSHLGRLSGPLIAQAHQQMTGFRPTLVYGVPYVFEVLAHRQSRAHYEGLRWVISSSAPLPTQTFDRVSAYFGVPPRSSYCLAEAGSVTINVCEELEALRHSVGAPLDGMQISVDKTDVNSVGGRLVVEGDSCGVGYRTSGQLEPFADGKIRTNDTGVIEHGLLTLTGRSDEVIQVAGQNVDLGHVRTILQACSGLGEFAVVSVPHVRLGTIPLILVEARLFRTTPEEVLKFCRANLRTHEVPRELRVVDRIPRSATGKPRLTASLFEGGAA